MSDQPCSHERYEGPREGVSTQGYVLVGFLCRKCGEWVKARKP